jgi:hypothetical protein
MDRTNSKVYTQPNQTRSRCHKNVVQFWELRLLGAGDENRTRVLSLGS